MISRHNPVPGHKIRSRFPLPTDTDPWHRRTRDLAALWPTSARAVPWPGPTTTSRRARNRIRPPHLNSRSRNRLPGFWKHHSTGR